MAVIHLQEKKLKRLLQEINDLGEKLIYYQRAGTGYQKENAKRKLAEKIEKLHEVLGQPEGKLVRMKPSKPLVTTYQTGSKVVHIINKPDI